MAEIGGSATDVSTTNLDTPENSPSTSNEQQKGGSLKRHAEADDKPRSPVKKKKTAEEIASTARGRNPVIKELLKKHKKQQRKEHKPVNDVQKLMEHRDRLLMRIAELEERDMSMSDRAEEKALIKEEKFRKALAYCEMALKKAGHIGCDPDEQNQVPNALIIHIPDWPCLDQYVQDFAFDRLDSLRERGVSMTVDDLSDIIQKVRSRDHSVKFPTDKDELERLLIAVNHKIGEAVHERRFDNLMKNLVEYPTVDAKEVEAFATLEGPLAILKVVKKEGEEERQELRERVGRVIEAVGVSDNGGANIEVIDLDDEDDEERECDEDELDEEDEEEEDEDDESDRELLRALDKYRVSAKKGVDRKEKEPEERELNEQPELPEVMEQEDGTEEAKHPEITEKTMTENSEEENVGPVPMEENEVVEEEKEVVEENEVVEGDNEEKEQMEQTDPIAEKTMEETAESREVREIMERHEGSPSKSKDERPDSREGKEVMEGGTSTNSPTVDRDERLKELDKSSDVKEMVPKTEANSDDEVQVLDVSDDGDRAGPWNPREFKIIEEGDTIVLDDDDEASIAERRRLIAEIEAANPIERVVPPKLPPINEDEITGPPDHPPVHPRMSVLETWRRKVEWIQEWVDKLTTDPDDIDNDIQKTVAPVATSYDDDEEIKCLIDDFEMDSVSHSGLKLRQQQRDDEKEGGRPAPPSPPSDIEEEGVVVVKEETVQREVPATGNDSIIMLD